ncbi:MAG: hypothetical protein K2Y56_15855 [Methylobacterium sp.]|uniref:hypothetical protein n=1 Tax=Methylobacterium sp. TaxID=409 RepID=UPI0025D27544|nr:hypothetical protein [Methylobacterium sp.]MBX9932990.1 hypothetical protein [Methylobacterium sp.]
MSDVHEQLVTALRAVVAEDADAHAHVIHALEVVEREKPAATMRSTEEAPGPYAPNPWSMFDGQLH